MPTETAPKRRLPTGGELIAAALRMIRARHGTEPDLIVERRIRLDAEGAALLDALAARLDLPASAVVLLGLEELRKEHLRR
jgi:hypothetical protein